MRSLPRRHFSSRRISPDVNWFNDSWYDYTGDDKNQINISWLNIVHPEERPYVIDIWQDAIAKNMNYSVEARLRNAHGDYRWHLVIAKPLEDSGSGLFFHRAGIATDIHDLRVAREKFKESEETFRTIANTLPQIVWSALPDGYHDYFNDRFYEITGLPRGSSFGVEWIGLVHKDDENKLWQAWQKSLDTGEPYNVEYRIKHRNGQYRWTLARALPIRNEGGKIIRWMGTSTDIHEQKLAQEQLQEAVQIREEFLSIASHELKTPLTTIQLQTQLELRSLAKDRNETISKSIYQTTLKNIERQIQQLVRLVEDMLDVSRIRSGRLILDTKPFGMCDLLQTVVQKMASQFENSGMPAPTIEVCAQAWGKWDPIRIEQVIVNLLTNAIRYGSKKPVTIKLEATNTKVKLSVKDGGIGIAKDSLQSVFDRFERATKTSATKGLGLGLYISKKIIQAHGGRIWAESELGNGSTFIIELPRQAEVRQS